MKRLISILLAFSLIFSLSACGSGDSAAPDVKDEPAGLTYPFNIVNPPMDLTGAYDYRTICYQDTSLETNGYVYIKDYSVTPVENEAGMVDKAVTVGFIFSDDNARNYGMKFNTLYTDLNGDGLMSGTDDWTVSIDGQKYPVTVLKDEFWGEEWLANGVFIAFYDFTVRVADGYDDIALFIYNSRNKENIAPGDTPLPESTKIVNLVDSHSQWFILGDEEGGYYGNPVEKGESVGNPDELISNNIYDGDAPPPVYTEDGTVFDDAPDVDAKTRVEIMECSHNVLNKTGVTDIDFEVGTYNWSAADVFAVKVYSDDMAEPLHQFEYKIVDRDKYLAKHKVSFDIDGTQIKSSGVHFEFALKDSAGNVISIIETELPLG